MLPCNEAMTDEAWAVVYFGQVSHRFGTARFEDVVDLLPHQIPVAESFGHRTQAALMSLCLASSRPYQPNGPARTEFEHALELSTTGIR
jgi:hypothetical protein